MSNPKPDTPAPAHTLDSLTKELGEPDADLEEALLEGATDAELIAAGANIATKHVISDQRRIYSQAFDVWTHATSSQKDALRGFSKELLAIAVARALRLEGMLAAHHERNDSHSASKEVREAAARVAFSAALTARDQAYTVLLGVAGQQASLRAEVENSVGTAPDGETLANGLDRLIAIGRRFLENKKSPLAKRAKLNRLDDAYLESLSKLSAAARETAKQASARSGGKGVTQGALDREDGVNLILLGAIMDAFESAHDRDGSIPRLVPIATRRLFKNHRAKAKETTPPVDKAPA